MSAIDWKKLQEPFPAEDIEWRLQTCGEKTGGGFWALCLAYVTNRAIMQRLDDVVGPGGWQNEYRQGPHGGVICGLSIKVDDEWVTKWDGAENTQVEAVKGGLSDSMKRAGYQWGIGRYLYKLEEGFAKIYDKGQHRGQTKEKKLFKWDPPELPAWALPPKKEEPSKAKVPQKEPATRAQIDKINEFLVVLAEKTKMPEDDVLKLLSRYPAKDGKKEGWLTKPELTTPRCSKGWAGDIIGKAEKMLTQ